MANNYQPINSYLVNMTGKGLGISLSYDIVKAHGGVTIALGMKVASKEGVGSEFQITLPIQKV